MQGQLNRWSSGRGAFPGYPPGDRTGMAAIAALLAPGRPHLSLAPSQGGKSQDEGSHPRIDRPAAALALHSSN
jgi:hypothetical protein